MLDVETQASLSNCGLAKQFKSFARPVPKAAARAPGARVRHANPSRRRRHEKHPRIRAAGIKFVVTRSTSRPAFRDVVHLSQVASSPWSRACPGVTVPSDITPTAWTNHTAARLVKCVIVSPTHHRFPRSARPQGITRPIEGTRRGP